MFVGKTHHLADVRGYAYEHRLVAETKLGRPLVPGECVHHVDGDRTNNSQSNIEVHASHASHKAMHRKRADLRTFGAENPLVHCECGCGATFRKFDSANRPRRFLTGHARRGKTLATTMT